MDFQEGIQSQLQRAPLTLRIENLLLEGCAVGSISLPTLPLPAPLTSGQALLLNHILFLAESWSILRNLINTISMQGTMDGSKLMEMIICHQTRGQRELSKNFRRETMK
jgi:hypothetical protein